MFLSFSSTHGCPVHDPWPFGGPWRHRQKQNRKRGCCWIRITDGAWGGCRVRPCHDCPCRAHGVWPRGGTLLPCGHLPVLASWLPILVPTFFYYPSTAAGQKPHLTPLRRRDSNRKNERKQPCLARSMLACSFQPRLISYGVVFFFHNNKLII